MQAMGSLQDEPWQLGCPEWRKRGEHMLRTGVFADCKFSLGGVTLSAHRLMLAAASPVFEAMLYGGMSESVNDAPIPIPDVSPEIFKRLLDYLYTDNINIDSFSTAYELYYAANKYMLPHLCKVCATYIATNLTPQTACKGFELGRLFNEDTLMRESLELIKTRTKEVLNDDSILEMQVETLETIFSLETLAIDSELDLFNVAERYVMQRTETRKRKHSSLRTAAKRLRKSLSSSSDEGTPGPSHSVRSDLVKVESPPPETQLPLTEEKTEIAERLLAHVRLLTLSAAAFAAGPARSPLLPPAHAFTLLLHVADPSCAAPLPSGYLSRRDHRARPHNPIPPLEQHQWHTARCVVSLSSLAETPELSAMGARWRLTTSRAPYRDKNHSSRHVSYLRVGLSGAGRRGTARVQLRLLPTAGPSQSHAHAVAAVHGHDYTPQPHDSRELIYLFSPHKVTPGSVVYFEKFIAWENLVQPQRGFVADDKLLLELRVRKDDPLARLAGLHRSRLHAIDDQGHRQRRATASHDSTAHGHSQ